MVAAISGIGAGLPRFETNPVAGPSAAGATPLVGTNGVSAAGETDFAAVMRQVAGEAAQTMRGAEAASIQGIRGEASTQAVVEAVMAAERTLQTAVALREKVTAAYLELSRMSI